MPFRLLCSRCLSPLDRRARGRTPRRHYVLRAWLIVLALVLTGCQAQQNSPEARSGAVLRVATPFLGSPDPVRGGFNAVQFGLAETLMRLDTGLQPQPWLATSVRPRSASSWQVTLRPGVTFHDGSPMDAAAVKASLDRSLALSATASTLLDVRAIEVQGPLALLITTRQPTPQFPGLLTEPSTAIVSASAAAAQGEAFTDRPVTTSLFRVERYQLDRQLEAVRYDGHWAGPARTQRLLVDVLPDAAARFLALQSGQVDVAIDVQPDSVGQIARDQRLRAVAAEPVATVFTYLQQTRPPLDDPRVRRALAHAAPQREVVVASVLRGQGEPARGVFPPAVLDCPSVRPYPHDLPAARRLLAQAGYQDRDGDGTLERSGAPLEIELLTYPQRPALTPTAEVLQAAWTAAGARVRIRVAEQIDQALQRDDWQAGMYFNNVAATGDPYGTLGAFFGTTGDANAGRYSSPLVDRQLERLRGLTDRQQRRQLACQIEQELARDVAVLPLVHPHHVYGIDARVRGLDQPHPYFLYFMTGDLASR